MEYIDIYNEEGNPLGIKKTKKEVHEQGFWHRSVHVWITNSKGEILIQKRSPLVNNHPNEWDISSAGHISAGENDITSALRETEEELGLKLAPEDFIQIGTVRQTSKRDGYINNEINPVYVVRIDLEPDKIKKQEDEVSEVKFISHGELECFIKSRDPSFVQHPEEYKLLFEFLDKNHIV